MELSKNLSKNMRLLRGSRSQAEFSKEIGVAKATVQAIEAQSSAIRLDTLELICNSLGVSPQAVLSDAMDSIELNILVQVLNQTKWFLLLDPEEQQLYIQWLHQTAQLFTQLSSLDREKGK